MGSNAPELKVRWIGPLENWCKEFIEENNLVSIKMFGHVANTKAKD